MPSLKVTVEPFEIPELVIITFPGGHAREIALEDLDEETAAELLEEFSAAVLAKITK